MTKIKDILKLIEEDSPFRHQEDYDNSGLIVGDPEKEISRILLSIDVTEQVVDEAKLNDCELILAHHPIIFRGIKSFTGADYVQRTVEKAIRKEIGIMAAHTNLDNSISGVNRIIAEKLSINNPEILANKAGFEEVGAGMVGELESELTEEEFLSLCSSSFKTEGLRHSFKTGKKIKKVAFCGGAGSFLIKAAKSKNADAFITGDLKYHEYFDAEGEILLVDPGHFESEQFTVELFSRILSEKIPNIALQFSEVRTNPIHYFFK